MQLGQCVEHTSLPPLVRPREDWYTLLSWSGELTYDSESELMERVVDECVCRRTQRGAGRPRCGVGERMALMELLTNARVHASVGGAPPWVSVDARLYRNDSFELTVSNYVPLPVERSLRGLLAANQRLTFAQRNRLIAERMRSADYSMPSSAGLGLLGVFNWAEIAWRFEAYDARFSIYSIRIRVHGYRTKGTMKTLYIEQSNYSPLVTFDPSERVLTLGGVSRPQNTVEFYRPVMAWLEEFVAEEQGRGTAIEPCRLFFDFDYFNSISSKYIMGIILKFKQLFPDGEGLTVHWRYTQGDDESRALGEDMAYVAGIDFAFEERPEQP